MLRTSARERQSSQAWTWFAIVLVLLALAALLTYLGGGTKTPIPHAFYIPIVISAGMFGIRSGLATAITAGVVCGPLMPLDATVGTVQPISGWIVRLGFFAIIGFVVGLGRNRLLALSRDRQNFLSMVSHELRTPLTSVIGFASLLSDRAGTISSFEQAEFAETILKEATELSNVVDHFVVEGRLTDSALFIESHPTDLTRIIEIVLDGLPAKVREDRITVSGERVLCLADPVRLRQILRSVLNNALAYTTEQILIEVTTARRQARVMVTDGASSSFSQLSKLASWQASAPSTLLTSAPPLGIGLAVSRDLARRMGGKLDYQVASRTSFDLRLPVYHESPQESVR